MKTSRRWNKISGSGRRRIEELVKLMRERDRLGRRVNRSWVPVRVRKDGAE